ncbi:cytochrome c biogenesis protein DipZ [Mycobacterium sp.]|uniref:cytochrome c biogenesis protein DipZ n=1 Tax=Mycobacterium sp. TaxID=1785 RepID=UPI00126F0A71|nr:cytochrome c biogenesis protein DipZ [Mycobacterium sp.]KAA8966885.1 MAG: cytochrome c biogenesis protein DipZ [Mycobacterium sp.]
MLSLALIGLLGGLVTGISPCVLPVLPVIFFSGAQAGAQGAVAVRSSRPYQVIAGLVVSFSLVTLAGSALLSVLHLPQDVLRWAALLALVAIGLGLIFPRIEQLLERPFSLIPRREFGSRADGLVLGLTLGVLYVPCAGPVLAAIVVAGATAHIGVPVLVLTAAFAVGTGVPLLFFALAGHRVAERVGVFRRRQREIRVVAGIVTILLAVALVFHLPTVVQRAIPDYTGALQNNLGGQKLQHHLFLGGLVNDQNRQLSNCTQDTSHLEKCGPAPDLKGITAWLNTPGDKPIDLQALRGNVVLIDFWAYSCVNCQRAIAHVEEWYRAYHGAGLEIIGVHTPEYAFEKVTGNVKQGAADLGITYPIALDNRYATWTNYRNRYWPAEYLIDAHGVVRHIHFGEGDYDGTEQLIRQLLTDVHPDIQLPPPVDVRHTTGPLDRTPETYFGAGKMVNYAGVGRYDQGTATFAFPPSLPNDSFALRGLWTLDYQGARPESNTAGVELAYHAKDVYIVVGGTGHLVVTRAGKTITVPISGPPNAHQIVAGSEVSSGFLEARPSAGLTLYSFTYG